MNKLKKLILTISVAMIMTSVAVVGLIFGINRDTQDVGMGGGIHIQAIG